MKLKTKLLRITGAVSASVALFASRVTSMTAFADVSPVPGSSFAYDFTASVVTEATTETYGDNVVPGDIAVTFQVTNNPGLVSFGFALFDGGGYEIIGSKSNAGYHSSATIAYNYDNNCYIYIQAAENNLFGETDIKTENFYVTTYFRPTEEISEQNSNFTIALIHYNSPVENIKSFNVDIKDVPNVKPEISIEPGSYSYIVGDTDNNGWINVDDAVDIYAIASKADVLGDNSVEAVNSYRITDEWVKRFPKLQRAEVADADQNGKIEESDGNDVLHYYSQGAASMPMESIIGKTITKTIYGEDIL